MTAPDTLLTDEFLTCHPRREIGQLIQQPNDGVSIVWGKIMTIIEEDLWWHSGRLSQPGPSQDNTSFSSVGNSSVTPRFNIKVQVYDGNELTYFKLPHEDVEKLLQISCKDLVNSVEEPDYFPYPAIFGCLIGQSLLFLVHVDTITAPIQERSFTVNKVCSDPELIRMYLKGEKFCHHGNTISTFGRLLGQLEGYTYHFPHLAGTYIGAAPPIDNYNPSSSNIGQPSSSNSAFFNYLTSEIDAELDLDDPIDKYCVHWTPANDE